MYSPKFFGMKKELALFLLIVSSIACSKEKGVDEVIYEVTLINSITWHGSYLNENAQVIGVTNAPSGWRYSFKNSNHLVAATLTAYPDGLSASADCNLKILVNSSVVISGKSSISPMIQHIFP